MTSIYISRIPCLKLIYKNGTLTRVEIINEDKVLFDVLRKDIELYDEDLPCQRFELVKIKPPKWKVIKTFLNAIK